MKNRVEFTSLSFLSVIFAPTDSKLTLSYDNNKRNCGEALLFALSYFAIKTGE